jgi:hypothetical protein
VTRGFVADTTVGALAPGERFSAANGTSWTLERNHGAVSFAIRHEEPGEHVEGRPVGHGERDRFAPHIRVRRGWAAPTETNGEHAR